MNSAMINVLSRRGRLTGQVSTGRAVSAAGWSPYSVFVEGSQGLFFDIDDFSTLFQDTLGTVPVTAVGQDVGKMLDKSGNGNHVTFTVKPVLRLNAETGHHYLESATAWGSTSAINFTGTNKVTVCAGIRKLSDATVSIICEFSGNSGVNNGAFALFTPSVPGEANSVFRSRGTGSANSPTSGILFPAPASLVYVGVGDIANDIATLQTNGQMSDSSPSDQGTGNYGNYIFYLFRRSGSSLQFAGHFYSLLVVGKLLSTSDRANAAAYMAARNGVTLP